MKIFQGMLCNYSILMARFHLELAQYVSTKKMFGLVFIEYIKEPINYRYRDGSTGSESLNFFRSVSMGVFYGFEIHHPRLLKNHFDTLPL
jgi:hypothetical protein